MSKEIPEEVKFIEERRAMIDPMLDKIYLAGMMFRLSQEPLAKEAANLSFFFFNLGREYERSLNP